MNAFAKTGIGLGIFAAVMIAASSTVLHAQGVPAAPVSAADRVLSAETRPIAAGITAVEANASVDVVVRQGAVPSMTVRAEKRLLPYITTEQSGSTLRVSMRNNHIARSRQPMRVEIVLPQVDRVVTRGSGDAEVSGFSGNEIEVGTHGSGNLSFRGQFRNVRAAIDGSGDVTLDNANADTVELRVSGSGDMQVSGSTGMLRAELHGSGDVDADRLAANAVSVRTNGSGDASVNARQKADLNINGSGDIHVSGQPSARAVSRNGSGEVSWN